MSARAVAERGSASVWVVVAGLLVVLAATVVVARTEAVLASHRAGSAADLAALAAAAQIGVRPPSDLCARAARVAAADGAAVVSCATELSVDGRSGTVLVVVTVAVSLPFVGHQQVRASARAARLPGSIAPVGTRRVGRGKSGLAWNRPCQCGEVHRAQAERGQARLRPVPVPLRRRRQCLRAAGFAAERGLTIERAYTTDHYLNVFRGLRPMAEWGFAWSGGCPGVS